MVWVVHLAALVQTVKQPENGQRRGANAANRKRTLATKVAHEPTRRHAACAATEECRTRVRRYPEVSLFKKYMQQYNHTHCVANVLLPAVANKKGYIKSHREATLLKMSSRVGISADRCKKVKIHTRKTHLSL